MTASTWSAAFDNLRNVIYTARTSVPMQGQPPPSAASIEEDRQALVMLRTVCFFWVDATKLSAIIQEFCSSFLHFRKPFQNTIAIVAPLLITRWLERFPNEFVQLHTSQKRRDSGPDTLFDMTHTIVDNGRRRTLLYPLQTTLLFMLPEVFEVASNLREAKSGSMAKKVGFLDGLRKSLRNRNEHAAYCLVLLLRAARHFDAESDSAFMSYAMDVQDEVKEAVFRRFAPGSDGVLFEQDIMTAAFVSLTHLNFDLCVESLAPTCLIPSAPHSFKISVIQACSHFARLGDNGKYEPLFTAASAFIQGQLQVRCPSGASVGGSADICDCKDHGRPPDRRLRRRPECPAQGRREPIVREHCLQHPELPRRVAHDALPGPARERVGAGLVLS